MGLMSFFKGVGEKLFGKNEQEAAEKTPELKASALLAHVQGLGIPFNSLTVKVNGDTVTVSGETDSQEDAEKIALAVGNVEGVVAVDNQIVVATPAPEARYYTVVKGDSLSKIAKEMYGNAMKYPVIFEANKPMLKDPDLIYPGQVLRIPEL
ncbi:MAG: peptidoglycan-binding protein LysM [Cytophagaceae bacterium]|nr:peptidoglycan-binding protein LysM [Cytophagaceae bacterium]MBK9508215.1 peptidoglycan-binding protein LysM [Cytophagaceae bacterium]MBK9936612.1 peptidoglycan-binding protein LysM [Cytophagaceae bacterium]MBL0300364.1 peptidoglycan-binding protein LysM [Cytophagaceae bacterium]